MSIHYLQYANITLIPKLNTYNTNQKPRTNFLMNVDANILNKILASQIWNNIKKIIHVNQMGCILEIQGQLTIFISKKVINERNTMKNKYHGVILNACGENI